MKIIALLIILTYLGLVIFFYVRHKKDNSPESKVYFWIVASALTAGVIYKIIKLLH